MRLPGKVAIITGAGSGIGRESALLFAQEGARVTVADINEKMGRETVDMIGEAAFFIKVDVSSWPDTKRMVAETVERWGRLDILFNNAGIDLPQATTVVETSEADWDRTMAINLTGVFLGSRHALPVMMAQRSGVIINTASRAGLAATPGEAAYCASKGGVVSLTRQMALDYAPYQIRVNCICPGALEKPTLDRRQFLQTQSAAALDLRKEKFIQLNPLGRLCTAKDVAKAALFLASAESAYITGTALLVDGGDLAL
ncbi:MAG: short-chain dehydrogenase [Anaerolineae bacterium]|nr:SDR family oxidoreductase [Anaerolineales bacterium]MCQ3978975.1 short-chain dehydrogenase [Anaerolineae bacterium]